MEDTPNNSPKKVLDDTGKQRMDNGVPVVTFAKRQEWDAQITKFVQAINIWVRKKKA